MKSLHFPETFTNVRPTNTETFEKVTLTEGRNPVHYLYTSTAAGADSDDKLVVALMDTTTFETIDVDKSICDVVSLEYFDSGTPVRLRMKENEIVQVVFPKQATATVKEFKQISGNE